MPEPVAWSVYVSVVENLPDAALLYDLTGTLVHLNPAAMRNLGGINWTAGSSSEPRSLVVASDARLLAQAVREARAGRSVPSTRLRLGVGGGTAVAACVFTPLQLDGQHYVQIIAQDVTARARAEQVLADSELQFRALFDHSPVGVGVLQEGRFTHANAALAAVLGRTSEQLIGLSPQEITVTEDRAGVDDVLVSLRSGGVERRRKRYLRPDGTQVQAELTAVRFDAGRGPRTLVHVRDLTQEHAAADRLRHLALHDPLTGLGNRTLLQERLELAVRQRRRGDGPLGVLFIDIDDFKRINDVSGHALGDRVLTQVAHRLRETVRPRDLVARWGGDEFVVILEDLRSPSEALRVVQRMREVTSAPMPDLGLPQM